MQRTLLSIFTLLTLLASCKKNEEEIGPDTWKVGSEVYVARYTSAGAVPTVLGGPKVYYSLNAFTTKDIVGTTQGIIFNFKDTIAPKAGNYRLVDAFLKSNPDSGEVVFYILKANTAQTGYVTDYQSAGGANALVNVSSSGKLSIRLSDAWARSVANQKDSVPVSAILTVQ